MLNETTYELSSHERGLLACTKAPWAYRWFVCRAHGMFFTKDKDDVFGDLCWHCGQRGEEFKVEEKKK